MLEKQAHRFNHLSRGVHPSYQESTALWDAHNIRLTSRFGESLQCITNEKSTKELFDFNIIAGGNDTFYIGHTVINDWLVLFLNIPDLDNPDYIIRINISDDNFLAGTITEDGFDSPIQILYNGDLGFNKNYPAQLVQDYEANLIQKVYWTDGINKPRLINIAKPELKECTESDYNELGFTDIYKDAPFDFIPELELQETCSVERVTNTSGGLFPAGAVQYALSYVYKYQQESNIFYTSELLYSSYNDRGGDAETSINTAFKITVENPQTKFDYLRIYSILRTSLNGTPVCKKVIDIDLSDITDDTVTFIDTNITGEDVDSSSIYYENKDILAGCIEIKENNLFLGNITYNRQCIKDIGLTIADNTISCGLREVEFEINKQYNFYKWFNQLSKNTSTFKGEETYRLGVQFQYKTGEWSEPVFMDDIVMDWRQRPKIEESDSGYILSLPKFYTSLGEADATALLDTGYIRVRPLIVFPYDYEKDIICQGLTCPTVFQALGRKNNAPHVFSSWLMRPMGSGPTTGNTGLLGATAEWRHFFPLTTGRSSGIEIQNMNLAEGADYEADSENTDWENCLSDYDAWAEKIAEIEGSFDAESFAAGSLVGRLGLNYIDSLINDDKSSTYGLWYVDRSINTLHTPDIEFNDSNQLIINNSSSNLELYIVGIIPFEECYGDIDIDLSTVQANPDAKGSLPARTHSSLGRPLISGLFFHDSILDDHDDSIDIPTKDEDDWLTEYLVHMWHRTGALNNDCVRPADMGTRTGELKTKIVSNISYSQNPYWKIYSATDDGYSTGTPEKFEYFSEAQVFNSDEITLLKFSDSVNKLGDILYYGNCDILNPSYTAFNLVTSGIENYTVDISSMQKSLSITATTVYISVKTIATSASLGTFTITSPSVVLSNITVSNDKILATASIDISDSEFEEGNYSADFSDSTIELSVYSVSDLTYLIGTLTLTYIYSIEIYLADEDISTLEDYIGAANQTEYSTYSNFSYGANFKYIYPTTYTNDKGEDLDIGDYWHALCYPLDGVRIKYKSTPHAVIVNSYNNGLWRQPLPYLASDGVSEEAYTSEDYTCTKASSQYWLDISDDSYITADAMPRLYNFGNIDSPNAYLWLCELRQSNVVNKFGGTSNDALLNNVWLPAGPSVLIEAYANIEWIWGDTWYQRYDCLKTYPYSDEDTNQVIEIGSFMCETYVNIDGRYDRNRGLVSNINVNPTNFNLINTVYSQKNNFFTYQILDDDYYKIINYPNELFFSAETKSPGAIVDSLTKLHMATSLDLDGSNGVVKAITAFGNALYAFQDSAVNLINYNSRAVVSAGDGVPIEIAGANKVEGYEVITDSVGCQDKFSLTVSTAGIYFVDNNNCSAYFLNSQGRISDLKYKLGSIFWFRENRSDINWRQLMINNKVSNITEEDEEYEYLGKQNNIRVYYDPKYQDIYFIPGYDAIDIYREGLVYNEELSSDSQYSGAFTSFMNYDGAVMLFNSGKMFSIAYDMSNDAVDITSLKIWENWADDEYTFNNIFGLVRSYSFSFISNEYPTITKIFDNVGMRVDYYDYDGGTGIIDLEDKDGTFSIAEQAGQPFNYMRINNEYQDTGNVAIDAQNLRKKFRVWRAQIPRNKDSRDRIRNPWAKITFGNDDPDTKLMILHDIDVNYSY